MTNLQFINRKRMLLARRRSKK